jgi:hypothetical protein
LANQNTIQVTLLVKDDGSIVVQQFGKNTEEALGKTGTGAKAGSSALATLKSSWLEITVAVAAAGLAISKAMEYMEKGAKAEQAEASFRTLAAASGESADQIIANMKRATNNTIDDSQLMQKAVKAMMMDFNGDQITKMAEMARQGARMSGEDVGQVFDKIADAISTNMPKALRQYGLITKEQMAIVNQAMAEGETETNLLSIATDNYNKQIGKSGPLLEDNGEKMQQYRKEIEETKESFGRLLTIASAWMIKDLSKSTGPIMATAASIATGSTAPIQAWQEDVIGLQEAQKELARYQAALKNATQANQKSNTELSASAKLALKKAELETLKALDKDYFKSQEDNLKAMVDLMKAVGGDEYQITKDSLQKREELNAEYFQRMKKEVELDAAARGKADRDKISDISYVAEKIKALDAEVSSRAVDLARQRTALSIQTAQNDIKNLQSRLGEYQTYYDSLKAKMDKNIEDEKKHLGELMALRQQSVDIDKSTASLIAGIKGTDKSQSAQQQYESQRSALNSQYGNALNLSGQDEIKALEAYKQAVAALQQQFAQGVKGPADIFGKPNEIISSAQVAGDAISDIMRAEQNQQNAIARLAEARQQQIEADKLWGQTLSEEAEKAKTSIDGIKTKIQEISDQILNMQKTITLTGEDKVSDVIASITTRIEELHKLAAQPLKIGGGGGMSSDSGGSSSPNTDASLNLAPLVLDHLASGTPYVPRTGIYQLHQGEAVVPAAENKPGSRSVTYGDINIVIPANAAPQRPEDWRAITRNYIVPELRKLQ